ncbi:hypothetical protein GCM10027290_38430 [Micromonospora sonneratiae]
MAQCGTDGKARRRDVQRHRIAVCGAAVGRWQRIGLGGTGAEGSGKNGTNHRDRGARRHSATVGLEDKASHLASIRPVEVFLR